MNRKLRRAGSNPKVSGQLLREHRESAKLSLSQMAAKTGTPKTTLAAIEIGRIFASIELVRKYESALSLIPGAILDELIDDVAIMPLLNYRHTTTSIPSVPATSGFKLPRIMNDPSSCFQAVLELLHQAATHLGPVKTIHVWLPSLTGWLEVHGELREMWEAILIGALQKGWTINQYVSGTCSSARVKKIVDTISLTQKGHFFLRHWRQGYDPIRDHLLVEGIGVLDLFSTSVSSLSAAGIFYPIGSQEYDLLAKYSLFLISGTQPTFEVHRREPRNAWSNLSTNWKTRLSRLETTQEGECSLQELPSHLFVPSSIQSERLRKIEQHLKPILTDEQLAMLRMEDRMFNHSQDTLKRRMKESKCRHIVSLSAIKTMMKSGWLGSQDRLRGFGEMARMTPSQCREYVQHIIKLLQERPQFELALLEDTDRCENLHIPEAGIFSKDWRVTSAAVLLESTDATHTAIDLLIEDHSIARAFAAYHQEIWDRISPSQKDKSAVIHKLAKL